MHDEILRTVTRLAAPIDKGWGLAILVSIITLVGVGAASAQTTTYRFVPVSGDTVMTGTIEFAEPPSSAAGAWSTSDIADVVLIDIVIEASVGPVAPFSVSWTEFPSPPHELTLPEAVASSTGAELDAGEFVYEIPIIIGESNWFLSFSATPGQDQITFVSQGGLGNAFGDWQLVEAVPVPISPVASWAMAIALIALGSLLLSRAQSLRPCGSLP